MRKFEYFRKQFAHYDGIGLDKLGSEGWELVSVIKVIDDGDLLYVFKREAEEPISDQLKSEIRRVESELNERYQ